MNFVEMPSLTTGLTRRDVIPSKLWVLVRGFPSKSDAVAWCKDHGQPASMVQRRHGRFESLWVISDGSGRLLAR